MQNKTVGFTDWHGFYDEISSFPPPNYQYKRMPIVRDGSPWFPSPVEGYMSRYDFSGIDIVESVMDLVNTKLPWVHSLACLQESVSFSFLGLPIPRRIRLAYANYLFGRSNCKALVFWSHSGLDTLKQYGGVSCGAVHDKARVVYPCIRHIATEEFIQPSRRQLNVLFSGDFFRKGGVNAVDAFEAIQTEFPEARLRLCCDLSKDFNTANDALKQHYIKKIKANDAIEVGRVSRQQMMNEVLPTTDIYLLPTYSEAFGYAALEAMAYGIPVIATNHMAIPEIIEDRVSGLLIDIQPYNYRDYFRGYMVNDIPTEFRSYVTSTLTEYLARLMDNSQLRASLGRAGQEIARTKFSVARRNKIMAEIYES